MDPDATVELINDAIFTGDLCSAYDHVSDLDRWIANKGMIPWVELRVNREIYPDNLARFLWSACNDLAEEITQGEYHD